MKHAAKSLICAALQRQQRSAPFASQIIAQTFGHGLTKFPTETSVSGRLLFWDHFSDQGSFIHCPPDAELNETTGYKAGLPILVPPDTAPTPESHDATLDDSSSRNIDDALPERDIDNSRLRADEPAKGLTGFGLPTSTAFARQYGLPSPLPSFRARFPGLRDRSGGGRDDSMACFNVHAKG